ncbi:hypothetical protein LJ739_07860 [Aestuariibacter halophilus]|uniref:Uncharacterized protein n=1 Tax=Fluctibacter halophilus TaxID=226011 RepID=A0ABS8G7N8_9ALTE|nr:hypothetical protein [Aestuariibacter halophilus]MCC2616151.1 hypothetical protein [Aestuariibacter halophilus]
MNMTKMSKKLAWVGVMMLAGSVSFSQAKTSDSETLNTVDPTRDHTMICHPFPECIFPDFEDRPGNDKGQ